MKKLFFPLLVLVLFACNKKETSPPADTTNPEMTLNGQSEMAVVMGTLIADPGVSVADDRDGDISSQVNSDWATAVDQSKPGNYQVRYSVADAAGNSSAITRKVTVIYTIASLQGYYTSIITHTAGMMPAFTYSVFADEKAANGLVIYPLFNEEEILYVDVDPSLANCTVKKAYYRESTGTGTITSFGRNIDIIGAYGSNPGAVNFTLNMVRK